MSEAKKRSETVLKGLVIVLVGAVLAQTYFLYQMYSGRQANNYDEQYQGASVQCPINVQAPTNQPRISALPPAPSIGKQQPNSAANQQQLMSALQQMLGQQAPQQSKQLPSTPKQHAQQLRPNMNINMFGPSGMGRDPFDEMEQRMQQMMSAMMGSRMGGMRSMSHGGYTSPTIQADKDNYIVKMKMPGLDKSEVKTQVNGNMLTISGTQKETTQDKRGNNVVAHSQRFSQFQNSLPLPGPVQSDKLKVDYDNNVLTITIPKA